MGKLVPIGGGDINRGETLGIDKEVVSLTRKDRARALFTPTTSDDSYGVPARISRRVWSELGCVPDVLYLLGVSPTKEEL